MTDHNTYKDTTYSKSADHYFYDGQLRKAQVQFAAVFSELQVQIGKNDNKSQTDLMTVPVKIGSMDRVVGAIMAGNTQNKPIRVPAIAVQMIGIDQAFDFIKGSNQQYRNTTFPLGSVLPDDGKVIYKLMPFPYFMQMEVSIIASNEHQHQQILEQILLLFNPDLQIQISDQYSDWTKISHIELTGIGLETNYPGDDGRRFITTTMNFKVLIYLSPAMNVKENYIKKVMLRISALNLGKSFDEFRIEDVPGRSEEYDKIIDVNNLGIPPK